MIDGRGRVLLVEDSPTQAARLRSFFEADNLTVVVAASAEIALEQLEAVRPDVIVLDYHLPGMNGDDFCREIRLNVNTRAIPVLMLTSEKSDLAETRGLESGADDYLVKSADPDILLVRVRALLRKSQGRRWDRGRREPLQPGAYPRDRRQPYLPLLPLRRTEAGALSRRNERQSASGTETRKRG